MTHPTMNIVAAMDDPQLFKPWFPGDTWAGWRTVLKGAFAIPMTEDERAFFQTLAAREPPTNQVKELWIIAGRRAGKDSIASEIAAYVAAMFEDVGRLRPGERALVLCLAVDRDQSKICLNYARSYFTDIELLQGMVTNDLTNGFELNNQVDITVATNSFRSVRGRAILCAIMDEVAFWRSDDSASPDTEVYTALRPGLASVPGSILVGISSPYRRSGLLFKKYRDHYGNNSPDVLVIKAPTVSLNPTIDQSIIDEAMADDPAAARAEWLAEFRDDISDYVSRDAVLACISTDVRERPRIAGVTYSAFVDPSGGSSDSMTLGLGHRESLTDIAVLDVLRERKPPFSPESVVDDFSETLKAYGITTVRGDRYAGEWPREQFRKRGIVYQIADMTKNEIYRSFLPAVNSRRVDLLDNTALINQLVGLERRTARGGKDTVDHAQGSHDDVCNAAAGVLHYVAERDQTPAPQCGRFIWA